MTVVLTLRIKTLRDLVDLRRGRPVAIFSTIDRAQAFVRANPIDDGTYIVEASAVDCGLDVWPETPILWRVRLSRDGALGGLERQDARDYEPEPRGRCPQDDPYGSRVFDVVASSGDDAVALARGLVQDAIAAGEWPEPEPLPA